MTIAKPYPYLYSDKDRQGRVRWRLRLPGRKAVTVKGRFGTPEFAIAYRNASEGCEPTEKKGVDSQRRGTMAALACAYLRSGAFAALSFQTQRARRYLIEQFVAKYGNCAVGELEPRHIQAMMDRMASTPGMARNVLSVIRILMALAMEESLRTDNPALGIKRPKLNLDGWHTWTEGEIAQYELCHPVGSEARLALALALHTGQRRSDLIRMGKQHVRDGKLVVRQQKTGTSLEIPIHRELREILDVTPSDHLTFLVTKDGKPYSANGFTHRFKLWARQAGLRGCPLHGLRKAACRRLAEAGCGAPEIMSISGHKTLSEVERYIKSAEQKLMAERAILRTESYPRGRQVLPTEKKA